MKPPSGRHQPHKEWKYLYVSVKKHICFALYILHVLNDEPLLLVFSLSWPSNWRNVKCRNVEISVWTVNSVHLWAWHQARLKHHITIAWIFCRNLNKSSNLFIIYKHFCVAIFVKDCKSIQKKIKSTPVRYESLDKQINHTQCDRQSQKIFYNAAKQSSPAVHDRSPINKIHRVTYSNITMNVYYQ